MSVTILILLHHKFIQTKTNRTKYYYFNIPVIDLMHIYIKHNFGVLLYTHRPEIIEEFILKLLAAL